MTRRVRRIFRRTLRYGLGIATGRAGYRVIRRGVRSVRDAVIPRPDFSGMEEAYREQMERTEDIDSQRRADEAFNDKLKEEQANLESSEGDLLGSPEKSGLDDVSSDFSKSIMEEDDEDKIRKSIQSFGR